MKTIRIALAGLFALSLSSCIVHRHPVVYVHPHHPPVPVPVIVPHHVVVPAPVVVEPVPVVVPVPIIAPSHPAGCPGGFYVDGHWHCP